MSSQVDMVKILDHRGTIPLDNTWDLTRKGPTMLALTNTNTTMVSALRCTTSSQRTPTPWRKATCRTNIDGALVCRLQTRSSATFQARILRGLGIRVMGGSDAHACSKFAGSPLSAIDHWKFFSSSNGPLKVRPDYAKTSSTPSPNPDFCTSPEQFKSANGLSICSLLTLVFRNLVLG